MRSHLRATLMGSGLLIACSALLLAAVTGALVLAAVVTVAGSLALGPAGTAISSPPAGSADRARERAQETSAPSHGATGAAGKAQRTR